MNYEEKIHPCFGYTLWDCAKNVEKSPCDIYNELNGDALWVGLVCKFALNISNNFTVLWICEKISSCKLWPNFRLKVEKRELMSTLAWFWFGQNPNLCSCKSWHELHAYFSFIISWICLQPELLREFLHFPCLN